MLVRDKVRDKVWKSGKIEDDKERSRNGFANQQLHTDSVTAAGEHVVRS